MSGVRAKRCDLAVVQYHHRDYVRVEGAREYDDYTVGVVTSVTWEGDVRMFRRAGSFDDGPDWRGKPDRGEPLRPGSFARALVMSAGAISVPAALAVAACRVWNGHEDSPRPYESLAEVRAALRPCADPAAQAVLGAAAAAWEEQRREARLLLRDALDAFRSDRARGRDLSARYEAATVAANAAFREAYCAAAGVAAADRLERPAGARPAAPPGQQSLGGPLP